MSGYSQTNGNDLVQANYYQQTPVAMLRITVGGVTTTLAQAIANGGGIPDAPNDGSTYGRHAGSWVTVVPAGTGTIVLSGLPTSNAGLVTGQLWNNGGFLCIA